MRILFIIGLSLLVFSCKTTYCDKIEFDYTMVRENYKVLEEQRSYFQTYADNLFNENEKLKEEIAQLQDRDVLCDDRKNIVEDCQKNNSLILQMNEQLSLEITILKAIIKELKENKK